MRTTTLLSTIPLLLPTLSHPFSQCAPGTAPSPIHTQPPLPTCLSPSASSPSSWHPWTHPPYCTTPPPSSSSTTPHCVFTTARHALSIITTPDAASTSLHPLLFSLNQPFFAPHKLLTPRPYAVRAIPGKGYGAVATRHIEKGRVVLVDTASVLAMVEYPADVPREEVRGLLREAAGRLGDPGRVEGLATRGGRETEGMEEIMLTNSFGVEVGGGEYMALFADLARFNHACRPNAFIHFSQTTLAMSVWSARDIEPGEEITITYSAAGMTSKERQETLEKVWGFKCTCSLCTDSPGQLKVSDANREEIRSLQDKVVELAQAGKYHKAVKAAERMFSLIEEEGMTEHMGGMYEIPARLYYHIGKYDKALEYTLKVRHEIDGYGLPGRLGEEKMKMLEGVVEQIKQRMREKKK